MDACKEALNCSICLDTISTPKVLSCGHSFCLKPCLSNIARQNDPICPLCREPIQLPPSKKTEDLPTNYSVCCLLESFRNIEDRERDGGTANLCVHEQGYDDLCLTCFKQVCSYCQSAAHTAKGHNIVSVADYLGKTQKCLSNIVEEVKKPCWSEDETGTAFKSSIQPYIALQENITKIFKEILRFLGEEKLDLESIQQLQAQVKKDYAKFRSTREILKQEIQDYKRREDFVITQSATLGEYLKKLRKCQLSNCVSKVGLLNQKVSFFENLKERTEFLIESLTRELKKRSFDIVEVQNNLHDISENVKLLDHYIEEITGEYHTFLFQKNGIEAFVLRSAHSYKIKEEVSVMNLPDRPATFSMVDDTLMTKFETMRESLTNACDNFLEELRLHKLGTKKVQEDFLKVLIELENCKDCYDQIFVSMGRHFSTVTNQQIREYVERLLLKNTDTFVLESSFSENHQKMKNYFREFEKFKDGTTTLCVTFLKYLERKDAAPAVVQEKLKEIETRTQRTEFDFSHLALLPDQLLRYDEIIRDIQNLLSLGPARSEKFKKCFELAKTIEGLRKRILKSDHKSISFETESITSFLTVMEEKRNVIVCLLKPTNSEINNIRENIADIEHLMQMRIQVHRDVKKCTVRGLPSSYKDHCKSFEALNFMRAAVKDHTTTEEWREDSSLQELVCFVSEVMALKELHKAVRIAFAKECEEPFKKIVSRADWKIFACMVAAFVHPSEETGRNIASVADRIYENKHQWARLLVSIGV